MAPFIPRCEPNNICSLVAFVCWYECFHCLLHLSWIDFLLVLYCSFFNVYAEVKDKDGKSYVIDINGNVLKENKLLEFLDAQRNNNC